MAWRQLRAQLSRLILGTTDIIFSSSLPLSVSSIRPFLLLLLLLFPFPWLIPHSLSVDPLLQDFPTPAVGAGPLLPSLPLDWIPDPPGVRSVSPPLLPKESQAARFRHVHRVQSRSQRAVERLAQGLSSIIALDPSEASIPFSGMEKDSVPRMEFDLSHAAADFCSELRPYFSAPFRLEVISGSHPSILVGRDQSLCFFLIRLSIFLHR